MNSMEHDFQPGNLVSARGREWVVQNDSNRDWLRLRPLGGADDETICLIPELELVPVKPAIFEKPQLNQVGNHAGALLLRDALRLKLRAGAGPFRSFGNIAIEPRGYQLVPLLMALRLTTVRLLIADDVGIGKTIEAGLIARELLDRGEISRLAVLCPPHLVEQWQSELKLRFNLNAETLTAASVSRLERNLPHGLSLFEFYPFIVVSLDYIKSERHRDYFLSTAPSCVIVDEAHTCVARGPGKQLRFELLQKLVAEPERHLIMLTATPHSGDENAFYALLSLLDPEFTTLQNISNANHPLRQQLARHFVQRRRRDIEAWQSETGDGRGFPRRMKSEVTYALGGAWGAFFDAVQQYCRELAEKSDASEERQQPLIWYATLALLRCVASSPAAAVKALTTRLADALESENALQDERLNDGVLDDLSINDLEPPGRLHDNQTLQALIQEAERLSGRRGDPKLEALIQHLEGLLAEGFKPVVFCRYIATAHYVAQELKKVFPKCHIQAVTGEHTPEERHERVEEMSQFMQPLLVATDCLSEGINLQHLFTAVVHYDLAWNPTRHEQREGRVDRFGQQAPEVRCTIIYGQDNPVDGFVLSVILKKGERIQRELGILVPLPEDGARTREALVKAALMKRKRPDKQGQWIQASFDFGEAERILAPLQSEWEDALEKAKANRTVFAQRRIRPDQVLPEWQKQQVALGTQADVQRFLVSACARLNSPLEQAHGNFKKFLPQHLPEALRLRLEDEDIRAPLLLDFQEIHRSHHVVTTLADHILETSLSGASNIAPRCSVIPTDAVQQVTTLYLLRLRHQLSYIRRRQPYQMMAEETVTLAVIGRTDPHWRLDSDVSFLLDVKPSGNLPLETMQRELQIALDYLESEREKVEQLAQQRALALLEDHTRVREAARDVGQYQVNPCLPVDIIGTYVLLPDEL